MKTKSLLTLIGVVALNVTITVNAQTTAFTYQGKLVDDCCPATGYYDLIFKVYDSPDALTSPNLQQGLTFTTNRVPVTNGLFTVHLDFDSPGSTVSTVFTGAQRWLQIEAQSNNVAQSFVTLLPRTELTATPYALYAGNAARLNGQTSTAFAPASGSTAYVAKAGDTMTGALRLPANGLVAGANQLVLANGNLGIGTVAPGQKLDVAGSVGYSGQLTKLDVADNVAATVRAGDFLLGHSSRRGSPGRALVDSTSGLYVNFAADWARTVLGGRVGIGTEAPATELDVAGTVRATFFEGDGSRLTGISAGGVFSLNGSSAYYNGGNVGIGTSIPASTLHVESAGATYLAIGKPDLNSESGIILLTGGIPSWYAFVNDTTDDFQIQAAGETDTNPRIRLPKANQDVLLGLSGGNVGIGTTSPTQPLDVQADQASARFVTDNNINGSVIELKNVSGSRSLMGAINFNDSTESYSGQIAYTAGGDMTFRVGGVERVRFSGSGNAVLGLSSSAGDSGVYGENNGQGYGVAGRTTGTGVAVLGDNNNPAGWAGLFNGRVQVCTLTIVGGCDLAEPFQMSGEKIPEGAVVVIDEANPGHLKQAMRAYDTRVAGIVSGANGVKAGIALHQEGMIEGGQNVALTGRVYVKADARFGTIKPGDLLTTSDTPGHAMRVSDSAKAQGAILGKAMTALNEGTGLVLVLVSLQ